MTPVNYTLPYIIRISRPPLIVMSVILVPLIAFITFELVSTGPGNQLVGWAACLGIDIMFGFVWLDYISQEIQLSEEWLSYRKWFVKRKMKYSTFSEISYYLKYRGRGIPAPYVKISGTAGENLSINLLPFLDVTKIRVFHDVLKRKAPHAMIDQSFEENFPDPDGPG